MSDIHHRRKSNIRNLPMSNIQLFNKNSILEDLGRLELAYKDKLDKLKNAKNEVERTGQKVNALLDEMKTIIKHG